MGVPGLWDLYGRNHPAFRSYRLATLAVTLAGRRSLHPTPCMSVAGRAPLAGVEEIIHPLPVRSRFPPSFHRDRAGAICSLYGRLQRFFRLSWLFQSFTVPMSSSSCRFMVRSVMAVFAPSTSRSLDEGAASLALPLAALARRHRSHAVPGDSCGQPYGVTLFVRSVNQSDLDCSHTSH